VPLDRALLKSRVRVAPSVRAARSRLSCPTVSPPVDGRVAALLPAPVDGRCAAPARSAVPAAGRFAVPARSAAPAVPARLVGDGVFTEFQEPLSYF